MRWDSWLARGAALRLAAAENPALKLRLEAAANIWRWPRTKYDGGRGARTAGAAQGEFLPAWIVVERRSTVRILVTGGTGLLGNNAVRRALVAGHEVVALVRDPAAARPCFAGLDVRLVAGDVCDADAVRRAADGCDGLIHSAGIIHVGWHRQAESMAANGTGASVVARVARQKGLRMVHVSTTNTLAIGRSDAPADEATAGDGQVPSTYVRTKRAGEAAVERGIAAGLHAVIVHPGFMLGPWDWKPSSGKMLLQVARRGAPVAPRGGCSVCDARDVAGAVLTALERAPSGRHYILAGENWTYFELWRQFAAVSGRRGPIRQMRRPIASLVGRAGDLWGRLAGGEGEVNSAALETTQQYHWYRSDRAAAELGYSSRPARQSIADAADWFRQHGYWTAADG